MGGAQPSTKLQKSQSRGDAEAIPLFGQSVPDNPKRKTIVIWYPSLGCRHVCPTYSERREKFWCASNEAMGKIGLNVEISCYRADVWEVIKWSTILSTLTGKFIYAVLVSGFISAWRIFHFSRQVFKVSIAKGLDR